MPQEDPVLVGFSRLMNKYEPAFYGRWTYDSNSFEGAFSALSVDQVKAHKKLLDWMHRSLLPRLREQFKTLSVSLLPSVFWKQPENTRKLILETQSELDNTTDTVKSIIASICPACTGPMVSAPERADDQHLKGLKSYRLQLLKPSFNNDVVYHINKVCTSAHELFQQIKLAPDADVGLAFEAIDATIKIIESSELDLAQEQWVYAFPRIDETIWDIIRTANRLQSQRSREPQNVHVRKAAELAKLSIPMMKLIKIFFNKISKRGINQKRLSTYSKMSSEQIDSLAHSLDNSRGDLIELQLLFPKISENGFSAATSREAIRIADQIKSGLETTLSLVLLYCLALIKHTDGFESRDYYKTWFDGWSTAFDLAIRNFKCLAKRLDPTPRS
ncbi:hypothetical protein PTTG_26996 [Puccinia triticina 1-1 BBBD Race 1]|uniref:Uncharacterized protein n=1 Tax=Puccinia triticina (isolate 1-1 / race 1 (BBBD)) TaxID=630390 RepID=A0A180GPM3_PUCT1|nr:hypothetical protein PTTG_26996 [Puccinia triticina 1-1 BBBD Race 1]